MDIMNFNKLRSAIPAVITVSGIGVVAILVVLFVLSAGSAQAAGIEQNQAIHSGDGDSGGILLAAKDAKTTDAAKKDTKASDAKTAKDSKDVKAKAPAKAFINAAPFSLKMRDMYCFSRL